jgi:hypothetical protein
MNDSEPTSFQQRFLAQFEGKTIAKARYEHDGEFLLPVFEFTDGTSAVVWRDPEGNGPGHIALYNKNGVSLYPA